MERFIYCGKYMKNSQIFNHNKQKYCKSHHGECFPLFLALFHLLSSYILSNAFDKIFKDGEVNDIVKKVLEIL